MTFHGIICRFNGRKYLFTGSICDHEISNSVMVRVNVTDNNISVISWRSGLLVEETGEKPTTCRITELEISWSQIEPVNKYLRPLNRQMMP
jgi:hypothetical protein